MWLTATRRIIGCICNDSSTRLIAALLLMGLMGCSSLYYEKPSAHVSDPAVFTMTHVALGARYSALGTRSATSQPVYSASVMSDLDRYFRETPEEYQANHWRMDGFLDAKQRAQSMAQLYAIATNARLRIEVAKLAATQPSAHPGNQAPSAAPPAIDSNELKALQNSLTSNVEDSPFDALDRARDFYTAYALKGLTLFGRDSRVINQKDPRVIGILAHGKWSDQDTQLAKLTGEFTASQRVFENDVEGMRQALMNLADSMDRFSKSLDDNQVQKITEASPALSRTTVNEITRALRDSADKMDPRSLREKWSSLTTAIEDTNSGFEATIKKAGEQLQAAKQALASSDKAAANPQDKPLVSEALLTKLESARSDIDTSAGAVKSKWLALRSHKEELDKAEARLNTVRESGSTGQNAIDLRALISDQGKENAKTINHRLMMIVVQAQVHPGTAPNYMAGVRMRLVDARFTDNDPQDATSKERRCQQVKIISVHPTRSYDLDDQLYIEKLQETLQTAFEVSAPVNGANVNADFEKDARAERQERRRFLSRVSKVASFADAGAHEVGWNFFPSNLEVRRTSALSQLGDALSLQPVKRFEVRAYLEGGARDCAFYILVPKNLKSLTFEADYVASPLEPSLFDFSKPRRFTYGQAGDALPMPVRENATTTRKPFIVDLPDYDDLESFSSLEMQPLFESKPSTNGSAKTPDE